MKKNLLSFLLCLVTIISKSQTGNLVSISPNIAIPNQILTTTITGNSTVFQNSSPQGNIMGIYFQGPINANLNTLTVQDNEHLTVNFSIPLSTPPGTYSLNVSVKEWNIPPYNSYTLSLPSALTVLPPDGYVNGSLYYDLNKNGIRDIGETGAINQAIKLDTLGLSYYSFTDVNGNYSAPTFNGSYTVTSVGDTSDYFLSFPSSYIANISNNNSNNNAFGLRAGLISVAPNAALQAQNIELTVISESVFRTKANPNGSVTQAQLKNSITGATYSAILSNIKTIHPDTALITFNIPANAQPGNYDLILYLDSIYKGFHYLRKSFIIGAAQSFIKGNIYYDINKNGIRDTNEKGRSNIKVNISPDNVSAYTDGNGNYSAGLINGTHVVSLAADTNYILTSSPVSYSVVVNNNTATGKDFGISFLYPQYSSTIFVCGKRHCNRLDNYWINYQNNGDVPFDGYIYMVRDSAMTYASASPPQSSISGDTIFWNVTQVKPGVPYQIIAVFLNPSAGVNVNCSATIVAMNGPLVAFTTTATHEATMTCSFDPNDKVVTPEGTGPQHFIHSTDTLKYTINFQNTGNDTAFKVVLLDLLDANLDWSTFRLLGSSHSVSTELNQSTGLLSFSFFNILLPDSGADQLGSNGFVTYSIVPKTGLQNYAAIMNSASIYFDSNKPVITNSTLNTICAPIIGLNTIILQPNAANGIDALINNYPNNSVNTNYGTHPDIDATTWTSNGTPYTFRSFIRFNVNSIPSGAVVQQAILTLYNNPTSTSANPIGQHSGSNASWLQKVTAPWTENTITWNNQPATTTTNQITLPQSTNTYQDYSINVTSLVQDMVTNPASNFGFMLRLQTEGVFRTLVFASSDNADSTKWPKLSITHSYNSSIIATGPTTFCKGDSVILNAPLASGNSYQWQLNGANISGAVYSSYTASSAGSYTCVLTNACESATLDAIKINVPITTISSSDPICLGSILNLSSSGGSNYSWTGPNGFTSTLQNPSITNIDSSISGIYKVTISDTSGCSTTDSIAINVNPNPNATIFLDAGDLVAYCTTSGCNYQWYMNGNATCTNSLICSPVGDAAYTVVITDANGCSDTSLPFIITNTIERNSSDLISIYPNPVTDELNISIAQHLKISGEITITDALGKEIVRAHLDESKNIQQVKLPKLSPGIYLAKILSLNGSLNATFIIE